MNDGPVFSAPVSSRVALMTLLAGGLMLATACNAITGAGDLRLRDVDEEEDEDNNNGGTTQGTGGMGGAGGADGGTACAYPDPPVDGVYGKEIGDTISNSYTWQGYAEGTTDSTQTSPIAIDSYLDCDGSRGINALMIATSGLWCGNCQKEAQQLNGNMANKWEAMGIRVLTLIAQDGSMNPATIENAYTWKSQFNLVSTAVAVDPTLSLAPPGSSTIGLPLIYVIDPRTMQIVHVQEGQSDTHPELEALAQKNQSAASP